MTTELSTYSFTEEDINLITFALRRLAKQATMSNVSNDSKNLIEHIERMKKEIKADEVEEFNKNKTKTCDDHTPFWGACQNCGNY